MHVHIPTSWPDVHCVRLHMDVHTLCFTPVPVTGARACLFNPCDYAWCTCMFVSPLRLCTRRMHVCFTPVREHVQHLPRMPRHLAAVHMGLQSPEAIIWARAHIDTTACKGGVKRFGSAPQSASGSNHLKGAPGEFLSAHWSSAGSMQQKSVQAYFIVEFGGARVVQGS